MGFAPSKRGTPAKLLQYVSASVNGFRRVNSPSRHLLAQTAKLDGAERAMGRLRLDLAMLFGDAPGLLRFVEECRLAIQPYGRFRFNPTALRGSSAKNRGKIQPMFQIFTIL